MVATQSNRDLISMQRFINDPEDLVDETVRGFVKAHSDLVRLDENNHRVIVANDAPSKEK